MMNKCRMNGFYKGITGHELNWIEQLILIHSLLWDQYAVIVNGLHTGLACSYIDNGFELKLYGNKC